MKTISKSRFISGLQCEKMLWLDTYHRELAEETDDQTQFIFDQGHVIGELAQTLFPGGALIAEDHLHIAEAVEATRKAAAKGAMVLYEAGAEHDRYRARADILKRVAEGKDEWDMYEVKSGTHEDKEVYLNDLAVQKMIFDGAGYPIRKSFLVTINTDYVRKGPIEIEKLFRITDQTKIINSICKTLPPLMKRMLEVVDSPKEPQIPISKWRCNSPYGCAFMDHCWKNIPDDSVFTLSNDRVRVANALFEQGIVKIADIPDSTKLNPKQRRQVQTARTGEPYIDQQRIRSFLNTLEYPLYYLDFETYNPLIPPYDGLKPFQQIPFQFSLHIQEKADGELKHYEYLADGQEDPRPPFMEALQKYIGIKGSVVVYSAFEQSRLNKLAEWLPKKEAGIRSIIKRIRDLSVPFRNQDVYYPGFLGSYSIKAVLPVLVPDMSYEGLEIGEGGAASLAYVKLTDPKLPKKEREQIRKNLLEYCGQDTLAMVKLVEVLRKEVLNA